MEKDKYPKKFRDKLKGQRGKKEIGLCPPWPPIATLQPPSTKAVMTQLPWNEPWSIREEENVKLLQAIHSEEERVHSERNVSAMEAVV
ncbi:unnamed protein product, partial [Nesidiocoris tenuis]